MSETIRDGMRIMFDAPIVMNDGEVLRSDIYLPLDPGPHPVIMALGPYGKGLAFNDGHFQPIWDMMTKATPETAAASSNKYQVWELCDPERWTRYGYACVRIDSRGAGRSAGMLDLLGPREIEDYAHCIDWAGAQPWSNGKVGLSGVSFYAINQWLVACRQPKHLAAMFSFEGAADMYRDMSRHGGILSDFWRMLVNLQIRTVQHGVGMRGYRSKVTGEWVAGPTLPEEILNNNYADVFEEQKARALVDDWYRERSPDWSKVVAPFCSAGNWGGQGMHLRGNIEAFVNAASGDKYLEMHGMEHWTHYYTDYGVNLQKAFFDHYLKGDGGPMTDWPRVRLQVRHPGNRFEERHEAEWPLARTQWTKLYLDAASQILSFDPPAGETSATYEALGEGTTFLTEPLKEAIEITGPLSASINLSSSTTDADLFLILRVFGPDLKEVQFVGAADPLAPISLGWLRASHRKLDAERSTIGRPYHPHEDVEPLTPGQSVDCEVEIWPTSIVVPAGCRIGLSIRGRDFMAANAPPRAIANRFGRPTPTGAGPFFHDVAEDRPLSVFGGEVTLHTGGSEAPHLLLPIIPQAEKSA